MPKRSLTHPIFIFFFITLLTLAIVHYLALEFFLYWRITWFDMPMHFFGGAMLALGWHALSLFRVSLSPSFLTLFSTLVFVLMVSLFWEVFELSAGFMIDESFILDTSLDLLMDIVGGYVGYILASRFATL